MSDPAEVPTTDPPAHRLLGERGFKPGDDRSRVQAYQRRYQSALDLLALVTIWFVVVPPGDITTNHATSLVLLGLRLALSAVYAADILIGRLSRPRSVLL